MKKMMGSRWNLFFLILAAALVLGGLGAAFDAFRDFDYAAFHQPEQGSLTELFRVSALKLLLGGGMTAAGIAIGTVLLLHLIQRTARMEQEAAALRPLKEAVADLI